MCVYVCVFICILLLQAKNMEQEAVKEKERMTIMYAQSEQRNIKLQHSQNHLELQMKDMHREREVMIGRFKLIKAEKQKLQELYDAKVYILENS